MRKVLKIIWIVITLIVVIWGIILWINYSDDVNKSARMIVNDYNLLFSIKKIESNIKIDDKEFTKILVKVKNYDYNKIEILGTTYELLNNDDDVVIYCADKRYYGDQFDDTISNELSSNGNNAGYLYCETDKSNFDRLKISVITDKKQLDNGTVELEFEEYYIDLK